MRLNLLKIILGTICTLVASGTNAATNVELNGYEQEPLTISFINKGKSKVSIIDRQPAHTVLSNLNKLLNNSSTLVTNNAGKVEVTVKVESHPNSVNLDYQKLMISSRAITEITCSSNENNSISSIQSIRVKPIRYEIQSITLNDIKGIWSNASLALAFKTIKSEEFKLGLANCGVHLDTQNLKADLHHLNRM